MVVQPDVGRNYLRKVSRRTFNLLCNGAEKLDLCLHIRQFQFGFILVGDGIAGVQLQFHHAVLLFVVLQLAFGLAEFGVDFLQTAVDELFSTQGDDVLVLVGLPVVDDGKLLEIVERTLGHLVRQL